MQDRENNTAQERSGCRCEAQITEILTRLEKLEREALTEQKLADLPRSTLVETVAKVAR
jgi:hypothetical protein